MSFELAHGDGETLANFKRQLIMAGQSYDHLPEKPTLLIGLDTYLRDFYRLCTCRPSNGFDVSPIAWLDIRQYAIINEYDTFTTYFLHKVVSELDPVFMRHITDELKAHKKK